ncbi:MAG: mechanosensitive ion channel domain-containing protein [Pseudomonadota bacterium]
MTTASGTSRPAFILCHLIAGFVLLVGGVCAQAQTEDHSVPFTVGPTEDYDPDVVRVAPVEIDGHQLFLVRGMSSLPARERADEVEQRILKIAQTDAIRDLHVAVKENEFGTAILANGQIMTVVTHADSAMEGMERTLVAAVQAEAIERAILNYRQSRTSTGLMDSAMVALGWTAGFLVVTLLFVRFRKRLAARAGAQARTWFDPVEKATQSAVKGQAVAQLVQYLANLALWIIYLVLLYYFLSIILLSFAETRATAAILIAYVSEPILTVLSGLWTIIPKIVTLVLIFIVTRFVLRGLKVFFENIAAGNLTSGEFQPHWVKPTFLIARVVVIVVAIALSYPFIPGSDTTAFQGLTILAGIMVSLGSNSVISNVMAGLFVLYRRSANVGDRIKVGDVVGDVIEVRIMETLIKSIKNEMISIPNSQLLSSQVVNYSHKIDGRGLIVHTTIGIRYEEPPEKIIAMLIQAAHATQGLKKSPEPFVLWNALGEFSIQYEINAFTNRGSSLQVILSDLHRNIVEVFNANGTQIMTPRYDTDPETPKIPDETWQGSLVSKPE